MRRVRMVPLQAAGVALTLVAGVGVLTLRTFSRSDPLTVDEAVDRFRAGSTPSEAAATATDTARPSATTAPSAPARATAGPGATAAPGTRGRNGAGGGPSGGPGGPGGPGAARPTAAVDYRAPDGVYTYATTGYETASTSGPSARHDYPAETTMTIRHTGCGENVRWDAVEERWDDVHLCLTGAASKVTAYITFHEFFGQAQRHDFRCGGDSWFRPPVTRPGYRWSFDCTTSDSLARTTAKVVGTERMTVAGRTVEALHIRYDTTLSGSQRGTNPQDFWLQLDGPALFRQTSTVDAEVDTPFGSIRYHEEYDLRLKSLEPRR